MILNKNSTKPIYIQIAEWLETEILKGNFKEGEKVLSQYKLAEMFNINPATAAKGLNVLADENILYDRRGLGKFVSQNAKQIIMEKRKNDVLKELIEKIVIEAKYLNIEEGSLLDMVKATYHEMGGTLDDSD